jgi:CO/xanthine dehydrogenase Mo-binding subunit
MAQIAAEELSVPYEKVFVKQLDTDSTSFGVGAIGSHVTVMGGHGVRAGAIAARRRLVETAARRWRCDAKDVRLLKGKLVNCKTEEEMDLGEVASYYVEMTGGSRLVGEGIYRADNLTVPDENKYGNVSLAYSFATHVAEVEVDTETGRVTVLSYLAVHDSGRALNPMLAEGQVEGGVVMGMAYALTEEYLFKDGRVLNPNFTNYRVPTSLDVPDINVILLDNPDPNGPLGAKSIGEVAMVPVAPAIANAIYNAVGVRLTTLPMTPERVLKALKEKSSQCG